MDEFHVFFFEAPSFGENDLGHVIQLISVAIYKWMAVSGSRQTYSYPISTAGASSPWNLRAKFINFSKEICGK